MDMNLSKIWKSVMDREAWRAAVHGIPKSWTKLSYWTEADAEAPVLWPPDAKSQLIGKDPNAEKNWRQKDKGAAEDDIVI